MKAPLAGSFRFLPALAAVMLAGCASLDSDLKSADSKCAQSIAMTAFVTCLNTMEEPVWQKDAPDALADYRSFAAARMALALDLDSGKITATQFRDGAAAARTKFSALLTQNARNGQQAAAMQRAQDDMEQMLRAPPPGMDSMGMNNNMNM